MSHIKIEADTNWAIYLPLVDSMSLTVLDDGIKDYLENNEWNNCIGDLIPLVICNALNLNLAIVFKKDIKNCVYDIFMFRPENASGKERLLYIYKQGNHYQAIVQKNATNKNVHSLVTKTKTCNVSLVNEKENLGTYVYS